MIVDDVVHPLRFEGSIAKYLSGGRWLKVDDLLAERGLPSMSDRCGIASYGANRNPGTLAIKMDHYDYRSPGEGLVVPVLKGGVAGAEAVAAGLSTQGYFFADLAIGDRAIAADRLEIRVVLADPDQVRVLHASEGVARVPGYHPVVLPEVVIEGLAHPITPLAYVTAAPWLIPRGFSAPAGFAMIPAVGRKVRSLGQVQLWDLVLGGWDLEGTVADLTGIAPGPEQGAELMMFLNRQWWNRHENGGLLDEAARRIISKVEELIRGFGRPQRTLDFLTERGCVLSLEEAYSAGSRYGIGAP